MIFETPRLLIREYTDNDDENFFLVNGNEDVVRYIRPVATKEQSDNFLKQSIEFYATHPNLGRWAVREKATGNFVGSFALIPVDENSSKIQIGYALLPSAWGKGYATELVQYGMPFFFSHHKTDKIYALTEQANIASQNVLLKCGFKKAGIVKEGQKELLMFSIEKK